MLGRLLYLVRCVVPLAFAACIVVATDSGADDPRQWHGTPYVHDADTLFFGDDRLRIFGIDAPELEQHCTLDDNAAWLAGVFARDAVRSLIGSDPLTCRHTGASSYGRFIVTCTVRGEDLAWSVVRAGLAYDDPDYSFGRYGAYQAEAQAAERGIWRASCPESPRAYRQRGNQ